MQYPNYTIMKFAYCKTAKREYNNFMDNKLINQDQMREKLREYVAIAGTQTIAAFQLGFSAGYLSDALAGRRDISRQLAERLGYERVLLFRVAGGETK